MKQSQSNLIGVLSMALLFLSSSSAIASEHFSRFPGLSEVSSPDGQYLLKNIDIKEDVGFSHKLILRDIKTSTEKEIFIYGRYVDVLWSGDSKGLIINDHGGSDYANCIIFRVEKGIKKYDVTKLIASQAVIHTKSIVGNHHVYIEGFQWITNNKIKVRITGYGDVDPDGFSMWFEYTIGGNFKFIAKKSQDSEAP